MDETKLESRCRELMQSDLARGRLRSVASYQNLFAGYEDLVERVHGSIQPEGEQAEKRDPAKPATDPTLTDSRSEALLENVQFYVNERYRYGGEIGEGAMGRVIEVVDRGLERAIAMKLLRDSEGEPSTTVPAPGTAIDPAVHRFVREARIMARLDHPGIVPVYDFGVNPEKRIFFTMKRVEGRGLRGTPLAR